MPTHTSNALSSLSDISYMLAYINFCHRLLSTSTLYLREKPQDGLTNRSSLAPHIITEPLRYTFFVELQSYPHKVG